jgi:hypothetical protein
MTQLHRAKTSDQDGGSGQKLITGADGRMEAELICSSREPTGPFVIKGNRFSQ